MARQPVAVGARTRQQTCGEGLPCVLQLPFKQPHDKAAILEDFLACLRGHGIEVAGTWIQAICMGHMFITYLMDIVVSDGT